MSSPISPGVYFDIEESHKEINNSVAMTIHLNFLQISCGHIKVECFNADSKLDYFFLLSPTISDTLRMTRADKELQRVDKTLLYI